MAHAMLWNVIAWGMWGILLLGWRYALERRRQRHAAAEALAFLSAEPLPTMTEAV